MLWLTVAAALQKSARVVLTLQHARPLMSWHYWLTADQERLHDVETSQT